ncbi:MAG: DEAD/DEAH box helicase [Planctomycetes bacterium]|nr:DEAD/DEAH box helicase [Planctomycetota bacterium]
MRFDELDVKPQIQKALAKMGYEALTPVQEQTLPHILAGWDLVALAETGSGKTAACAVPLVQSVDPAKRTVQALILVPTRELALQYVTEISQIAQYTDIESFAIYGGFSMAIQMGKLDHGVHILVATPGRLIDMLYNTSLRLADVRTLVLDEADEMLNQGFEQDVEFIFSCLVHKHQTLLFSATMPPEIKHLTQKYLDNPVVVELTKDHAAPTSLEHCFVWLNPHDRLNRLLELIETEKPTQAILFCNSRHGCETLFDHLKKKIESVEMIHGGQDQNKRTSLFRRFKKQQIHYMIATDIAARGLDFAHTSHVINYDFPQSAEAYTHRTGRTARMGRKGRAITFCTPRDIQRLKTVLRQNKIEPVWLGEAPDLSSPKRGKKTASKNRSRQQAGEKNKQGKRRRPREKNKPSTQ